MKLPPVLRLVSEDYPADQQGWIGKLLFPINQMFQALSSGLKNGLTFQDNLATQVQSVTFNNNTSEFPIRFAYKLSAVPVGIWVVNAQDISTTVTPSTSFTAGVFPTWSFDAQANQIKITALTGLTSNHQYKVTFIVF